MERFDSPADASRWCRSVGGSLGFVPTMGALHAGHLELVRAARESDRVCVSVFVNPLQFDDPADLAAYPRDFDGDVRRLAGAGADAVFTGTLDAFFPDAEGAPALVDPGPAAQGLEGAHRAGHFAGVATIVDRLFDLVRPARAYFGEKDFQQTLVVRDLAARRGGPEIVVCPTVREPDGLALSSRNARLAPDDRTRAVALPRALAAAHEAWRRGERSATALSVAMVDALRAGGVTEVEYAEVRDPEAWTPAAPRAPLRRARALVAARVGGVRLIDNLLLDGPPLDGAPRPAEPPRGGG